MSQRRQRTRRPGSAPPRADAGVWRYSNVTPVTTPAEPQRNSLSGWGTRYDSQSDIDVARITRRHDKDAAELGEAELPTADWLVVRPTRRVSSASAAIGSRRFAPPPRRALPGAQREIGGGWVRLTPDDSGSPAYFWHAKKHAVQWANPMASEDPGRELLAAAASGDVQEAARCLRVGASVDTADAYGRTVLEHAAKASAAAVVTLLLRNGPPNLEARNRLGRTALHAALCNSRISAERGDSGCIGLLLKAGADPKAVTADGRTPHELLIAAAGRSAIARDEEERKVVHELLAVGVVAWERTYQKKAARVATKAAEAAASVQTRQTSQTQQHVAFAGPEEDARTYAICCFL